MSRGKGGGGEKEGYKEGALCLAGEGRREGWGKGRSKGERRQDLQEYIQSCIIPGVTSFAMLLEEKEEEIVKWNNCNPKKNKDENKSRHKGKWLQQ